MGFFDRLKDFGDREWVRTSAMKIDAGIKQIEESHSSSEILGLSYAVKEEVENMLLLASKLTHESLSCLDVKFQGKKINFFLFVEILHEMSDKIVKRGGIAII